MKLKTRLGLFVVGLVSFILVSALTLVSLRESRALVEQESEQRRMSVRQLGRLCETTLQLGQERTLLNFLGVWTASNQVVDVGLWDHEGALQTHSDFLMGDYSGVRRHADPALVRQAMSGELRESQSVVGGRRILDITLPIRQNGNPYGFLRARFDRSLIDAGIRLRVRQTIRGLLALGLIAELLGLVVGLTFSWSLTRPIKALTESAHRIGEGDFPETVPVRRSDELGMLARELERMSAQLKRASEFKDAFLRRVSHNMRSPLAAMESALYHASNVQVEPPEGVREDYHIMRHAMDELTMFINNLLDLERIRRGKMVFALADFPADEVLESVASLHRRLAEDKGLRLSVRALPAAASVRADRSMLVQILSNLVTNAIKFTEAGGTVELTSARDESGCRITVSDSGRGIPSAKVGDLFNDFVQVAPGDKTLVKGSGIGLAFCREAATGMGGRIWVESEVGRGSRFHLWLPGAA